MRLYLSLIWEACMLNTKLNKIQMQSKKTHKIKVNALFHRLQINKNIRFQTRIVWKRHTNKAETRLISHDHGYSVFEENLALEFNLVYDESKGLYEDKNTEIVAAISYEGKVKSGGYAKYNIAQVINQQLQDTVITIPLSQCPDPSANVQVTFSYSLEEEGFSEIGSVLNTSSRDFSMSRIDFHDDKISLQMDRINSTITKLDELAKSVKTKEKTTLEKVPQLIKTVQQLEGENTALKINLQKQEQKLLRNEEEEKERAKNDQKTVNELEKQLKKRSKQEQSREFIDFEEQKKTQEDFAHKDKEIETLKEQLSEAQSQLDGLKHQSLKTSSNFFDKMDDVNNIAQFDAKQDDEKDENAEEEGSELEEENNHLKNDLAAMSFKLAKLFNAAYDYGDAKLLDYLQSAIGLTQ